MSDFLAKALEKKRKEKEKEKEEVLKKLGTETQPKKFFKRGEKEKLLLEEEKKQQPSAPAPSDQDGEKQTQEPSDKNLKDEEDKRSAPVEQGKAVLHKQEVIRRLRARGQPITFFGETEFQREERMRAVEAQEPEESNEFGRNDFKDAINQIDDDKEEQTKKKTSLDENDSEDEKGIAEDPSVPLSGCDFILGTFKKFLKDWEEELNERPDVMKKSAQGKIQTATFLQTRKYLRPLFKLLRQRTLAEDIRDSLHEIATAMKERNYVYANDCYLRLAIGNSPWPMGVTMVGIHERSAREKIFSNQIAHVLNDETQRKYIQSVKRLISFCQKKYPVAPSQMVG